MMYRRNSQPVAQRQERRPRRVLPLAVPEKISRRTVGALATVVMVVVVGTAYGFYCAGHSVTESTTTLVATSVEKAHTVKRTRLCRDQIPPLDINTLNYSRTFADDNETQLLAARRNSYDTLLAIDDPLTSDQFVPIVTNELYVVAPMTHSKPCLVPEAAMMLQYIAERFQQLLAEQHPDHPWRFIVTSAYRSQDDVDRLRRVNRNASENSCHNYGTTIDISYLRFHDDLIDLDTVASELYLKNILAQTLYELRYEGICYVKYEHRQSCFHLTLRNPEYQGRLNSETLRYPDPAELVSRKTTHRLRLPHRAKAEPQPAPKKQAMFVEY